MQKHGKPWGFNSFFLQARCNCYKTTPIKLDKSNCYIDNIYFYTLASEK